MDSLVAEAWRLYEAAENTPSVVKPSIPILYFGDRDRYAASPLKVITVGLNPSCNEFPVNDPFTRFRKAQYVYPDILDGDGSADYLTALNDYFRRDPYWRWFRSLEPLLEGMTASYGDGQRNTALHTDICSPLATDPTWSGLKHERGILEQDGVELWLRLIHELDPDVVLISVARRYLETFDFPILRDWDTVYTVERANPYSVQAREIELASGKRTRIVFGRAATMPFGLVSNSVKVEIGRRIVQYARG
jgi:hypothetical protein